MSLTAGMLLGPYEALMAKNYVDNSSEEVKKELLEKAEQGHWPSRAPVGSSTAFVATSDRILELVKCAGILYKTQDLAEQRRVVESVLSNCTFDRGTLVPHTLRRSIC